LPFTISLSIVYSIYTVVAVDITFIVDELLLGIVTCNNKLPELIVASNAGLLLNVSMTPNSVIYAVEPSCNTFISD
jgi:hypothetical protein